MTYSEWVSRMPTDEDGIAAWEGEGQRAGYRVGEPEHVNGHGPPLDWDGIPEPVPIRPKAAALTFPEPEDRGTATLSSLGEVEYAEDLIKPARIVVVASEEGSGKTYAIGGELAIRMAVAGGSFAQTWPVLHTGPVLVLSEMHPDDDYAREATVLESLGLDRKALEGRYYRLSLMTAAGGAPALTVAEWRSWVTSWLRDRGAILLVIDTATGATLVDPWGRAIQQVYADLRMMLDEYPALAIVLLVHCKKPNGKGGERRISDVLGEWGRWCDVVMMLEPDGMERTKVTVRKRVRRERRIVATKSGGLLVDPVDITERASGPKVPTGKVRAEIVDGMTMAELAEKIGVSKPTAKKYVLALPDEFHLVKVGQTEQIHRKAQNTEKHAQFAVPLRVGYA